MSAPNSQTLTKVDTVHGFKLYRQGNRDVEEKKEI